MEKSPREKENHGKSSAKGLNPHGSLSVSQLW